MLMFSDALAKVTLPEAPGSYQFFDAKGEVIYVGKAKSIAKRVASYRRASDYKTTRLLTEVADIQCTVTGSEVEALLLEAKLIRQHQPKYNITLKGGERYAYIQVTNEPFPRLVTTRQPKPGDRVFGPYTSGEARVQAIHLANTLFKLRVCKRLPKRPCLLYHMKLCSAPCIGNITKDAYARNVKQAERLLRGDVPPLVDDLTREMREYAAQQEYEQAKLRRDQVRALQRIGNEPGAKLRQAYDQDVVNFSAAGAKVVVQVFHVNRGIISRRREFTLRRTLPQSDAAMLADFLTQYYYAEDIPGEVIVPIAAERQPVVANYLSQAAGRKVRITVPKQGEKLRLLELLAENIAVSLKAGDSALLELQEKLRLPRLPRVIECVDISNLGPTNAVGSLVFFRDGKPDKNEYRRFKVRTVAGQSDYDAMKEVIGRRFRRLLADRAALPDLLLVDGGKPQLSAAVSVFRELGLQQPVAALAKRREELYTTDSQYPLRIARTSPALKLVQRVRNEAHRFAIGYQRLLRGKDLRAQLKF
ncbi:MAG: excinuclease ABC subunit C [Parcubacteria group bacterium Gr01-1014_31]|nr:MAG: excinuclease ABC subunit C [Parcubacteria group bacterium Gr01-1014_31]